MQRNIIETSGVQLEGNNECVIFGGATKSKLWKQIFADVTGLPIIYSRGSIEAPLGDALMAGVSTGVLKDYSVIRTR